MQLKYITNIDYMCMYPSSPHKISSNTRRCEVELKFTVHYSLFGPNSEL